MKVVFYEVGKKAEVREIGNSLEEMQNAVGGYIQYVPLENNLCIICDEEGKLKELPFNRHIKEINDIIVGDFFICGESEEDFDSVPQEHIERLLKL